VRYYIKNHHFFLALLVKADFAYKVFPYHVVAIGSSYNRSIHLGRRSLATISYHFRFIVLEFFPEVRKVILGAIKPLSSKLNRSSFTNICASKPSIFPEDRIPRSHQPPIPTTALPARTDAQQGAFVKAVSSFVQSSGLK
jgi:hypothetical protein